MLIFLFFSCLKYKPLSWSAPSEGFVLKLSFTSQRFQYFQSSCEPTAKMGPRTCRKLSWVLLCAPKEARNSLELSLENRRKCLEKTHQGGHLLHDSSTFKHLRATDPTKWLPKSQAVLRYQQKSGFSHNPSSHKNRDAVLCSQNMLIAVVSELPKTPQCLESL